MIGAGLSLIADAKGFTDLPERILGGRILRLIVIDQYFIVLKIAGAVKLEVGIDIGGGIGDLNKGADFRNSARRHRTPLLA